jgi:hypothetical protein
MKQNTGGSGAATLRRANERFRSGDHRTAMTLYQALAKDPRYEDLLQVNLLLCRQRLEGQAGSPGMAAGTEAPVQAEDDHGDEALPQVPPPITITLTTIHSRLQYLPQVIESLHRQTLPPAAILLNISHEPYLLDQGIPADDPVLLELQRSMPLLRVNWVANTGPYRKIFWWMEQHFSQAVTEDKLFVTVDDDTLYPEDFLQKLYEEYLRHDCVVAFRGRHMELDEGAISVYSKWTWGRTERTLANLPTGKDGILYNTKFFTRDFLELADALRLAPTADDLWIKWHCALNGVPAVILNPEACTSDYKSFPVVNYDKSYRSVSLFAQHNSAGSHGKNDKAVLDLEAHFLQRWGYNLTTLLGGGRGAGA